MRWKCFIVLSFFSILQVKDGRDGWGHGRLRLFVKLEEWNNIV